MPLKQKKGWRDVVNPPENQFPTGGFIRPVEDEYDRGDNLQDIGYPEGLHSIRRADVWLNNIKSGAHVLITVSAPGTTTIGPLQIQPHGEMRGLYLDSIDVNALILQVDINVEWQIWSDGHRVANGVHSNAPIPIQKWFPPFSNETFYARAVNNAVMPPINVNIAIALHYVVFDCNGFEWKMGKGTSTPNPAFAGVDWPGFA